jgi:hypothetical protein
MSHFYDRSEFYNKPIKLNEEEMKNPHAVLRAFFEDFRLSELRELIGQIGQVCLSTDHPPFDEPTERANLIEYHLKLEMVFEAAFVIAKHTESLLA